MLKEGEFRNPSGCAIAAIISKEGKRFSGEKIVESMRTMHDRSNGLGGGFAGYGIYPEYADYYALHIFYDNDKAKEECEHYINKMLEIVSYSIIPTKKIEAIKNKPLIWRYFAKPNLNRLKDSELDEEEYISRLVFKVNTDIEGAYIFSSGKNMGVFKAVGFPEDVGEFYMLDTYKGYMWTAHGRYPTNTPGWWAGSHPFALLDHSIVHNGEISSYDANRRYMEMFGYKCNLQTDTEVMCYIIDYLLRKEHLTLEEVASVMAAPFWDEIDNMDLELKEKYTFLRNTYSSLLVTGPFSIIVGFKNGLMALNDRLKLRSLVVGYKDDMVYFGSEECAIRSMEPNLDSVYSPRGGEPVIVTLNKEVR
jgi:glutamate synthase domain-containing protein 1